MDNLKSNIGKRDVSNFRIYNFSTFKMNGSPELKPAAISSANKSCKFVGEPALILGPSYKTPTLISWRDKTKLISLYSLRVVVVPVFYERDTRTNT